jgi:hypothetical protein
MRYRFLPLILFLFVVISCASDPEPRDTVRHFLQSLRVDTTGYDYLSQLLDLDELVMENTIYAYDTTLTLEANKERFVKSLQKGGSVRERWIKNQIILGSTEVLGDTAAVEVSFVDKSAVPVKQYYNKMGVHVVDGSWKIFSLRLF